MEQKLPLSSSHQANTLWWFTMAAGFHGTIMYGFSGIYVDIYAKENMDACITANLAPPILVRISLLAYYIHSAVDEKLI